ncbi:MAG TPA: phytanoyl-CoA dioxygenase family protein [Caulobacteraceae bacterium]|nr:phytanoyl-CoA dioxygenase family protein [Caulobacteraceae bacterium]
MNDRLEPARRRIPLDRLPPRDWRAAARDLDRDGVVRLAGALTPDALARVEAAVDDSLAHPTPGARRFYPGETATFFEDRGQRHADLARQTGLDTMLAALWGEHRFWYLGEQLFLKEGGESRRTPWHQDTSYLRMKGAQLVACWISLDPLPRQACLEFVRGSHRGVLYNGSAFADDDDTVPLYKHSPLPRLPDIQARRDDFDIVSWDVTPGDVIVFHLGMLHGGAGTAAGMRRRTISMRFLGPDVRFDGGVRDVRGEKAGNDEALAGVYAGLSDGDPFPTAHLVEI